ncbi:MAG TPA: roadblock/LC7 domain-containing protein [Gemmatimonadaceae bacterium]|nr:roadblock/LC7 domain-containing protein [Gemmatimonadaceae bacterium]
MIKASVEPWIETPLKQFVDEAGVSLALLLHPTGQVLAQHGFSRAMDIMSACALAAAIHVSAAELGRQLEGKPFDSLHHAGKDRQIFLAEAQTARGTYIFLTVFDEDSSLGLVRMYFDEFRANLAKAAPPPPDAPEPMLNENFERELNRNLAVLFGRA